VRVGCAAKVQALRRQLEATLRQVELARDTNTRLLDRIMAELEVERARSRDLLLNILPQPIIDRLNGGERLIADRYDDVAVVFSDFVGALGPLVSRLAALRSNASPRRARGCMIRIASALAADSSAFHARPALLGCKSHRRVSELGGDVCGKADPVLSRHAERTCEVASGRSGSSSCRSVLLPG
jgi:hypothetical protein